jgi:hypothetical protein
MVALPQQWETFMKKLFLVIGLAAGSAACVPTTHETLAVACSDYIGRPISERIAALGPPNSVYRINPTQLGYVFETRKTTLEGGHPYYTVNYMVGVDKHRSPIYPVTTTCEGFIVASASEAAPISQRIIVDVIR